MPSKAKRCASNVSLTNKVDEGHGMAVAIVGLPGGCRLPADLKELTKLREDGKISYFEIRGRELILYWRSLKPNETDRPVRRPDLRSPRRIQRPRQPRLPLLQRRPQALGQPAAG